MTDKELMQQTLYTLEHFYENGYDREDCFAAITNLLQRLAQPERVQLTVRDFVVTVGGIEDAIGTPTYWAEWPNREQT